jgi:hypothetical protein
VDLKQTRIERLKSYARSHGVLDNPAGLGALIGKRPNQVYNLLHGGASFGEKVARSIEQAAGLPPYWLDQEVMASSDLDPAVAAVAAAMSELPKKQRDWVLSTVTEAIKLARETVAINANGLSQEGEASPDATRKSAKRMRTN